MIRYRLMICLVLGAIVLVSWMDAYGITRSWDSGGVGRLWSTVANWTPDGAPLSEDNLFIGNLISEGTLFNLPNSTTHVRSLVLTNGSSVDTNGFEMIISGGATSMSGSGTFILVRPNSVSPAFDSLDVDSLIINGGSHVDMQGGILEIDAGKLEINPDGQLGGYGRIDLEHNGGGEVFSNSGRIFVAAPSSGATPGELTIQVSGTGNGEINLDGTGNGWVDVDDGVTINSGALTLVINGPLSDGFSGRMDIGQADTVEFIQPWQASAGAEINFNTSTGIATLKGGPFNLIGSDIFVTGSGQARIESKVVLDAADSVVNIAPLSTLVLSGGDLTDVNRINQSRIVGGGTLNMPSGRALHGFGTIDATIDFDGSSDLRADDGILTVSGAILDVRNIGTADEDGILNVTNPWSSNGFANISLSGGEIRGGTLSINNSLGLRGRGLVSAPIINNTRIEASGTLVLSTASNNNDWDGAAGNGALAVVNQGVLELRDNSYGSFGGTVESLFPNGTIRTKGFSFQFDSGSMLRLNASRYEVEVVDPLESLGVFGTVEIGLGAPSRISVPRLLFYANSNLDLQGDLELDTSYTLLSAGAEVSGAGTLHQLAGGLLRVAAPSISARIYNEGTVDFGETAPLNPSTVIQGGFVQSSTGKLRIVLDSPDFARLTTVNAADLAGTLEIAPGAGYVFGHEYELIRANGGVFGHFNNYLVPDLGPHFGWTFTQTSNSVFARLGLAGDYNKDDRVDAADFVLWRDTLGALTNVAANGNYNGMIDFGDYVVWVDQYGLSTGESSGFEVAVPEPSPIYSSVVLLVSVLLYYRWRFSLGQRSHLHFLTSDLL